MCKSREIKFRAWQTEYKKMEYLGSIGRMINLYDSTWFDDNFFKLMQYTGLKDKNGKEIYEGDIIEFTVGKFKAEVMWNDKGFWGIKCDVFCNDTLYFPETKVIGNIYENPELLENGNE